MVGDRHPHRVLDGLLPARRHVQRLRVGDKAHNLRGGIVERDGVLERAVRVHVECGAEVERDVCVVGRGGEDVEVVLETGGVWRCLGGRQDGGEGYAGEGAAELGDGLVGCVGGGGVA